MDVYSYRKLYHRGGNISFRNSVAFIAVRSRLFATNTTLRNGPGKELGVLEFFGKTKKKKKKCRSTQGPWRTISINIGIIFLINL